MMDKTGDISNRTPRAPQSPAAGCCGGHCKPVRTKTASGDSPEQQAAAIDGTDLMKRATAAVTDATSQGG